MADGPARVVDLAAEHDISRPAISRHLRMLTEAGLVSGVDHGRERYYSAVPSGLRPVREFLASLNAAPIPEHALDGLDLEVRRTGRDRRAAATESPSAATEETA